MMASTSAPLCKTNLSPWLLRHSFKTSHAYSPFLSFIPSSWLTLIYSSISSLIYARTCCLVNHGFTISQLCLSFPICEMGVMIVPTSKARGHMVSTLGVSALRLIIHSQCFLSTSSVPRVMW